MEILKGFSFSLQRFATISLADAMTAYTTASEAVYWDGTNWVTAGNAQSTDAYSASYDGSTYSAATTTNVGATVDATKVFTVVGTANPTEDGVAPVLAATSGTIDFGGTNKLTTTTDGGKVSVNASTATVTSYDDDITVAAGAFTFSGIDNKNKTVSITGVPLTLAGTVNAKLASVGTVDTFTSGTISTANATVAVNGNTTAGEFTVGGAGVITGAAAVNFTTTATGTLAVATKVAADSANMEKVTSKSATTGQTLRVSDDGKDITLTNGVFTANVLSDGIDVNGDVTVNGIVYTSGAGKVTGTGNTGNISGATVTTGKMAITNDGTTTVVTDVTAGTATYGLTATTSAATFKSDGTLESLTAGDVTGGLGKSITVGTTVFTNANTSGTLKLGVAGTGKVGVDTGRIYISSAASTKEYLGSNGGALKDTVTAVSGDVNVDFNKGGASAGTASLDSGLQKGEAFSITRAGTTITWTAITDTVVREDSTASATPTFYEGDYSNAAFSIDNVSGGLAVTTGHDITVSALPTTGTTYYDAMGFALSSSTDAVVTVNRSQNTVDVAKTFEKTIFLQNAEATVTDSTGKTTFGMDATSKTTIAGKSFKVDANGVISDAGSNTITIGGTDGAVTVKGSVNVDATNALKASTNGTVVTYKAGEDVSNAKITLSATKSVTLTESNSAESAKDTTISNLGAIAGLEGDATVTTVGVTSQDITTENSGTFTINKIAYTVADDDNGVAFSVGATADVVDKITGLAKEATVAVSGKFASTKFTVNTTVFDALEAKSGATFTAVDAAGAATVTLFSKGDTVKTATVTNGIEVVAMGSASDGVVVGANTLAALNDGDKVKVYTAADKYYQYEVSGNVMVVSNYTGTSGAFVSSKTYTLSDSSDTGFTVGSANTGATINGDEGLVANVTFGTNNGSTNPAGSLTDGLYVNSDGTLTTSSAKAIAKIGVADDKVTYTSESSKGQEVAVAAGDKNTWDITTGTGKDDVNYLANTDATINSGAGDDTILINGNGDKVVNTGDGKNNVTLAGSGDINLTLGNGKDVVTLTGASTGDLVINATGGSNLIDLSLKGTAGDVTINGGSGNDTITASSADNVVSGGDGKDTFKVGSGITISDYSFENDVIFTNGAFDVTDEGKISVSGGNADISANAGDFYAAQIVTGTNAKAQNWAWAKDGGSNIDITSYTKDAHLAGDDDGTNQLYAGSGNDYIYSNSDGDSVYGGAGKNTIRLASSKEKRVVGVSVAAKGKDTITNFKASFEEEGDSFFLVDGNLSDTTLTIDSVSGSSANLTMKNGSASVSLVGAGVNTVTGAVEIKAGSSKIAAINKGAAATVSSASYADAYIGKDSAVNFSAVDGDLSLDLSNNLTASGNGPKFVGVSSVVGGAGSNTIIGSAKGDYMVAGTGTSSLYGGAGADTLVGNGEADMFFFGNSSGTDTITSFQAAGVDNADTVKVLGDITSAKLNGSKIELGTSDGSKAVINSLATGSINANTMVKVEADNFTGTAKLGESSKANNFTYDKEVGYYGGGSASDKITVASNFADNAEVWLDGGHGTAYSSIDMVDFTNGTGNYILAGDSSKNTIVGGKGENSLWGGAGNVADTIKGGAGTNTFFWGIGEGNDSISSSKAEDTVNLYTVKLADVDLTNTQITNSGVVLALNDGSKLTVQTTRDINFTVDGTSWTAVHNTKEWKQNS